MYIWKILHKLILLVLVFFSVWAGLVVFTIETKTIQSMQKTEFARGQKKNWIVWWNIVFCLWKYYLWLEFAFPQSYMAHLQCVHWGHWAESPFTNYVTGPEVLLSVFKNSVFLSIGVIFCSIGQTNNPNLQRIKASEMLVAPRILDCFGLL